MNYLSERNAEQIVKKISAMLSVRVSITNHDGTIIASNDARLLGVQHRAVEEVLRSDGLDSSISDDGTIMSPVVIDGKPIGALILDQTDRDMSTYIGVLRSIIEIFLMEIAEEKNKLIDENIRTKFVTDWLRNENGSATLDYVKRGLSLGFDIRIPRRVLAITRKATQRDFFDEMQRAELAERALFKYVKQTDRNNFCVKLDSVYICAIAMERDRDILQFARNLRNMIKHQFDVSLIIGVDGGVCDYQNMDLACTQAQKAMMVARESTTEICFYSGIGVEKIFLNEISAEVKAEYTRMLFIDYSKDEINQTLALLAEFYANNGSISATADALHIHKNTLQYKLNKITCRTNHNPKSLQEAYLFNMAILFNEVQLK